ncbi:site-2 protease family protein [Pseudomonadota bacterium]
MTEFEIRQILSRMDDIFFPHRIGSSEDTWVIQGHARNGVQAAEIGKQLKKEPIEFELESIGDEISIRIRESNTIILKLPRIPLLHIVLFLATVLTTLLAGTLMAGGNPLERFSDITMGISFSITLLLILGFHEFGHYYYARKHKVDATLPYFIPAPTLIGTFGAFIKIKSPIYRRDALLQIGAAGPIAGFLVAVPALIIGLSKSAVMDLSTETAGISLGDSILMKALVAMIFPDLGPEQDILLHPIAFAGWIGLLVTMLNLLPIGQLDGGHIAYALLGKRHNKIAWGVLLSLIPLSYFSLNWLVWGALILILMRSPKHPPIMDINSPINKSNKVIGLITLVIFILCFIPTPFKG